MALSTNQQEQGRHHELLFADLVHPGHGYVFPCDPQGHVNVDDLSQAARMKYLHVRAVVGREFFAPVIRRS